jgi:uncharacterized protein YjdB
MDVGETFTLKATKPAGSDITWSSSNKSVATVSGGKVTAVGSGTATITAKITYGGKDYTATCTVRVSAPSVSNPTISVTSSSSTIEYSELDKGTAKLTAKVTPDKGKIEWSISDSSVASISANGKTATVTAKSAGSVRVTATYTVNGKTVKDYCDLTVKKAASKLSISNIEYPSRSAIGSFYFRCKAKSNYQLTQLYISGKATSNATGWSATDTGSMTFASGIYEVGRTESEAITQFLKEKYKNLYNLYVLGASILGADKSLTITVNATIYDSSGNSTSFTIKYVLDEG